MSLLVLALVGCGVRVGDTADFELDPCATTDPGVQVGNGEFEHVPVEDGDAVLMTHGPQGGWHVWFSFEAYNIGETVIFNITGDDQDTQARLIDETVNLALVQAEDPACAGIAYGQFGYLPGDDPETTEDESPPASLAGHSMVMGVTVTDLTDATLTAHDEVTVTLACDPVDNCD